jgi:osmotically-inducible protein OsmY
MVQPVRLLLALAFALAALSVAPGASAQSPADAKRTLKIWQALYKEPGMIEVDARYMRGTVLITGFVPSDELMAKADEIVKKQRGVKEVRNRLRVRPPEVASAPCDTIMSKVDKEIEEDEELAQGRRKFEVKCDNSNVTVSGKVNDYTLANTLLNEIRKVDGVQTINFDKFKY